MKRYLLTLTAIALALGSAQAKKYADIKGRVTDTAGKPIAGAVVSNGIDCTATAADGTYSFDGTRDVRPVSYTHLTLPTIRGRCRARGAAGG